MTTFICTLVAFMLVINLIIAYMYITLENDFSETYSIARELEKEVNSRTEKKDIFIKYFNEDITKIARTNKGDWIDLRASETVTLKQGEYKLIPLGVGMKLPKGYEAIVAPRSSTFKNYGIIQTNSVGIIDSNYCGSNDQWMMPVYATRDTVINKNDRICQFKIVENQPPIEFVKVFDLDVSSRGGFGSTGIK